LSAHLDVAPIERPHRLGSERAEGKPPFADARRVGLGLGEELGEPAAAKLDVHVHVHRHSLAARRIEVNHRRLQPHGYQRVAPRGPLRGVVRREAGPDQQVAAQIVDELRQRLVVDVDAPQRSAVFVLQGGEGPPFVDHHPLGGGHASGGS
jgi:hypothetical protein